MTRAGRYLAALTVGAGLLISAGCGSSEEKEGKPLPSASVNAIVQRLDEVQRRYDVATEQNKPGACDDIENDSYKSIDATVEDLPDDVDADVRQALEESLSKLEELTREGCSNVQEEEPPKTETTPPETVPQETVPQETVPEQTTTQETTPQETKPGKDKTKPGKGNGNGNGNGGTTTDGTGGQAAPQAEGQ